MGLHDNQSCIDFSCQFNDLASRLSLSHITIAGSGQFVPADQFIQLLQCFELNASDGGLSLLVRYMFNRNFMDHVGNHKPCIPATCHIPCYVNSREALARDGYVNREQYYTHTSAPFLLALADLQVRINSDMPQAMLDQLLLGVSVGDVELDLEAWFPILSPHFFPEERSA